MSAGDSPLFSAIAFQLAAALEVYEEEVERMLQSPRDAEIYRRVSQQMDQMRMYAAALPPLSVAWVEVLIRHFEITHAMWRQQQEGAHAADLEQLRQDHRDAVTRLSRKCAQLMPRA